MQGRRDQMQAEVRLKILREVTRNPQVSQRALAEHVGVSVGQVHYVLAALVEKGFIKLSNFSRSPQKRRYAYVLTIQGMSEKRDLTRRFLLRKQEEYLFLRAEIDALYAEIDDEQGIAVAPSGIGSTTR